MPKSEPLPIALTSPPFDRYRNVRWLAPERSGHEAHDHGRHLLFAARERDNPVSVLIKVTSRPGLIYEQDLDNEQRSLATINRERPDSPYFPFVHAHGRLPDSRRFLITSLFDEFPLATVIGSEPEPSRLVRNLRIGLEIAKALDVIHALGIFHVDLNPMNVLYRIGTTPPIIRIVDFESSYERRRHAAGTPYSPPTTAGYSAPDVARQPPDARADVYSLGSVLYTLMAGYRWAAGVDVRTRVESEASLDDELKQVLGRAVEAEPARRFANAGAFAEALGAYLERIWPGRAW